MVKQFRKRCFKCRKPYKVALLPLGKNDITVLRDGKGLEDVTKMSDDDDPVTANSCKGKKQMYENIVSKSRVMSLQHEYLKNRPLPPLPLSPVSGLMNDASSSEKSDGSADRDGFIFQTPPTCVRRRLDFDLPPPPREIRRRSGIMGDNHHAHPNIRFKPPKFSGAKNDNIKHFFASFQHFVEFNNVPQDELVLYLQMCLTGAALEFLDNIFSKGRRSYF